MNFVSYAQNFEDVLLWRALRDVQHGRYIDIGAHDPIIDSVSFAFYEAGWRGVHVEPLPQYAARLREARPDETVVEAAVTDAPGPILFYELGGLSSGRRDVAEYHARAGHASREILVPTIRLHELLEKVGPDVHWLKIDVEGMEADVLRSWGEDKVRPWVLVIESTFPNSTEAQQHLWIDLVRARGYDEVFFDGLSRYFVHNEHSDLALSFAAPANVFDSFSITQHHFSATGIRAELGAYQQRLDDERTRTEQLGIELGQAREACERVNAHHLDSLERIASAERAHGSTVERMSELVRAAETNAAAAHAEVTRLQERSAQLEDKLERADKAAMETHKQLGTIEEQLTEARLASVALQADCNEGRVRIARLEERNAHLQVELERARESISQFDVERERTTAAHGMAIAESDRVRARLEREIELLQAKLAEVRTRIATADLDGRHGLPGFGSLRRKRAMRALSAWAASSANLEANASKRSTTHAMEPAMETAATHSPRNPYLRASSLPELLSWNDVADFVRCAYVTVLGRQADPSGEAYYASRLRRGHSKMEILWQLRHSPEAASHDPGITGFDRALRRHRTRTWLPRALRRFRHYDVAERTDVSAPAAPSAWQSLLPQSNAKRIDELVREKEALAADVEALKGIVDGLAHAVRGVANAQARHERLIREMQEVNASPKERTVAAPAKHQIR